MANYANQKRITVEQREFKQPYGIFNVDALQEAMSTIKTIGGIKIWMYINKNQNNYTFDLSRQELLNKWGLTRATYDSGLEELIALGYLTPINGNDKTLVFHETCCVENQHETVDNAENQHEKIVEMLCAENQQNKENSDENQHNIVDNAENRHNWSVDGFYF